MRIGSWNHNLEPKQQRAYIVWREVEVDRFRGIQSLQK